MRQTVDTVTTFTSRKSVILSDKCDKTIKIEVCVFVGIFHGVGIFHNATQLVNIYRYTLRTRDCFSSCMGIITRRIFLQGRKVILTMYLLMRPV